jgi:hypothetical protein
MTNIIQKNIKDILIIENLLDRAWIKSVAHTKIVINTISSNKRQNNYLDRIFLTYHFHWLNTKYSDIRTMMCLQSSENLAIQLMWRKCNDYWEKLNFLVKQYFWLELCRISHIWSNMIRLMRNNITHTCKIQWIESLYDNKDWEIINKFVELHWFSDHNTAFKAISAEFVYLYEYIIFLNLWLEYKHFAQNLRPPWKSNYFIK